MTKDSPQANMARKTLASLWFWLRTHQPTGNYCTTNASAPHRWAKLHKAVNGESRRLISRNASATPQVRMIRSTMAHFIASSLKRLKISWWIVQKRSIHQAAATQYKNRSLHMKKCAGKPPSAHLTSSKCNQAWTSKRKSAKIALFLRI